MPEVKRRGKQPEEEAAPQVSRLSRMQRDGIPPQLPPVDAGQYLVDWLFELGPTLAAGMGAGPLTFQEIGAWQAQMGLALQPWEVRALRQLSQTYLSEAHEATKPNRPPPYGQLQRNPRLDDLIDRFL